MNGIYMPNFYSGFSAPDISSYLNMMNSFSSIQTPPTYNLQLPDISSYLNMMNSFSFSGNQIPMPDYSSVNRILKESNEARRKQEEEAKKAEEERIKNEKIAQEEELKQAIAKEIKQINALNEAKASLEGKKESQPKKLNFLEKIGYGLKGLCKNVTNLWTDKEGKFSWAKLGTSVAIGAGVVALDVITCGALTPVLIGAGVVLGGYQTIKGVSEASKAKTREEEIKAFEDIGEGAGALALSIVSLRSVNAAKNASRAAKAETLATTLIGELKNIKNIKGINLQSFKTIINTLKNAGGNKKIINTALKEIKILSKTKGIKLPKSDKIVLETINNLAGKGLHNVKNAMANPLLKESKILTDLEGVCTKLDDIEGLGSIIARLKNATNRSEALKILKEAGKLAKTSAKIGKNELELLLSQLKRQVIQDNSFGTLIKSNLSKENLVNMAVTSGDKFKNYPYLSTLPRLSVSEVAAVKISSHISDEVEAAKEAERLAKEVLMDEIDEKIKIEVKELAKLLDIEIKDKTFEEIQEEIELKIAA